MGGGKGEGGTKKAHAALIGKGGRKEERKGKERKRKERKTSG